MFFINNIYLTLYTFTYFLNIFSNSNDISDRNQIQKNFSSRKYFNSPLPLFILIHDLKFCKFFTVPPPTPYVEAYAQ